jgi:glycine/D-amino acid oxidase-like deaminating enzyme
MGFRRKARSLGAEYIADEVVGIEAAEGRASAVRLASGATIPCGTVVVAAGAWSADVCAMAGMPLPVEPVRRQAYYFEIREKIEPLPLTIDPTGCWLRPEGAGYICGRSNPDEPAGYNFEVDYDWFDEMVWPVIAARVPAFEALKLKRAWTGLYAVNRLDENLIIGPWEGGMENLYVACGFSGHGLQQAPSVGRAMTELLLDGRFVTLDLSRLSYRRIIDNAPLPEAGIV